MSLILEALKKLDREKQAPDRGLVVVGPSAWPSARDGRPSLRTAATIAFVLAGIGAAAWHYGGRPSSVVPREMAPREIAPHETAAQPAGPGPYAGARGAAPVPAPPSAGQFANAPVAASRPGAGAAPASKAMRGPVPEDVAASPRGTPEPAPGTREGRSAAAAAAYQLQAISAQDGHPVAILNDRLVREGDRFDGVTVVRIGSDEVEIEVAGRRRVVKF